MRLSSNPRVKPLCGPSCPGAAQYFSAILKCAFQAHNPCLRAGVPTRQPGMDARVHAERCDSRSYKKGGTMNESQWELYRLSVVEKWAESPYKRAVLDAIEHKLMVLGQEVRETTVGVGCPKLSPPHSRNLSDSSLGRSSIPLNWCDAVSSDRSRTQPHPPSRIIVSADDSAISADIA